MIDPWLAIGSAALGWALAGYFIRLFYVGKVVSRTAIDDVIHDRDEWRAEGRIKDQHIVELSEQNNILLRDIAPTMNNFLAALRANAARARAEEKQS